MELEYLSRNKHLIPEITELKYQQYHHLVPDKSVDDFRKHIENDAHEGDLPIGYVAYDERGFIGMVSLRAQDLSSHSHLTPWLGGLFVHPMRRSKGVGTFLIRQAESMAVKKGFERLYLYTPNQADWYSRLGWKTMEEVVLNGNSVTVMSLALI